MRRILIAAGLSMLLAGSAAVTTTPGAAARPMPQAAACSGVWVVVDYGRLGGTSTQCATSYSTGIGALRSAGMNPTISEGFVDKINSRPSNPDSSVAYWSYWHATGNADGGYGPWTYSTLGADSHRPTQGDAEGWRYQALGDGKVAPGVRPPSGRNSPTGSASALAGSSAPSAVTPQASSESTTMAGGPVSAGPEPTSGTPAGLIVTAGLVLVIGLGLGGWWWLKGRRP